MITYPTYPQPILAQATTGRNWYLEITIAGILRAGGTTIDAPTPLSRLKLVDPTGQTAYKLGLDTATPPAITATVLSAARDAGYQDLSVWGINGREWNLRVTAAGSITINGLGTIWPTRAAPAPRDANGFPWQLTVSDGGVLSADGPQLVVHDTTPVYLRASDDSACFEITINTAGILFVTGPLSKELTPLYDATLFAPSGVSCLLSVDTNGVLFLDPTTLQDIQQRDEWPLVLQQRTNVLYVVDTRFRAPAVGRPSQYGSRRRG
jgi:hypothetical protein